MKILHIISDWKWTGPAEPVVNLCRELQRRGHKVILAIAKAPAGNQPVLREKALERGVELFENLGLRRRIGISAARDLIALKRYLKKSNYDIVHTHLTHDHALAVLALRGTKERAQHAAPLLVRTSHKGVPLRANIGNRFLMRHTDGLITVSDVARGKDIKSFNFDKNRVAAIQNAIDLERFSPRPKNPEVMRSLGIGKDDIVVGIVARLQRHRRFDVFLKAMKIASEKMPNIKAVVVGRGTYQEDVMYRPVKEMGLEKIVIPAGYRKDDYLDVLACFDMKVFLVPGSDGSCRAARELMAMGKPVIAARRGMLPEILDDGVNGLLIDDTPENLSDAIIRLAKDREMRERMGEEARKKAISSFSLAMQGEKVERVYNQVIRGCGDSL
jgi:glycosyltransferase involved in cell wall biosynthesis